MDDRRDAAPGAYGKLVTEYKWYFAAVMDSGDAAALQPGGSATLEFGRYYGTALAADVISAGEADGDGRCVAVFACDQAMAPTLAMRQVSAEVVFEELRGIRVPSDAVHAENGACFVYTVTGLMIERKDIEILCEEDGYVLAHPAAPSGRETTCRAGQEPVRREGLGVGEGGFT
jgi:hypothetical protein